MKKEIIFVMFIVLFFSQSVFALTGRQLVEKNKKLNSPDTVYHKVKMHIYKGKKVKVKEFELRTKKYDHSETKTLISFSKPSRIKLLTHTHKGKDDDQWIRLSSGRVKRIIFSAKKKSFVNSHFCYGDLSSRKIDDYTYNLLGSETVLGFKCHLVESIKKSDKKIYDRMILYIRNCDYFIVKIDFYINSKLYKTLENHDIRLIDGIMTPFKIVMSDAKNINRTELEIITVQYNLHMKKSNFIKEALR